MRSAESLLSQLKFWAEADDNVRMLMLGGSRAFKPDAVDRWSDYDIEVVVRTLDPFANEDNWANVFGRKIAGYSEKAANGEHITRLILFDDGIRIDFQIYTIKDFQRRLRTDELYGLQIILDKSGEAIGPVKRSFNKRPPADEGYQKVVANFWWDATYVAKGLKRGDVYFAKHMMEGIIRPDYFTPMMEWYIGITHDWNVNTNKYGRWFKRYLDESTIRELNLTYSDADLEGNWKALFVMLALFSKLAQVVGLNLGFSYPISLEMDILDHINAIRDARQ